MSNFIKFDASEQDGVLANIQERASKTFNTTDDKYLAIAAAEGFIRAHVAREALQGQVEDRPEAGSDPQPR